MIFSLNGKQALIEKPLTLEALVAARGLSPDKIVVEHNFSIISKEDWPKIMLKNQDIVEIVSFVGGG
ncbi:MAG: sulfur carrier protein ThiS [Candidatus Omnitrophota bacterium]